MRALIAIMFSVALFGAGWAQDGAFPTKLMGTSAELLGPEESARFAEVLDVDKEVTWRVHVPETYDPEKPAGLLVYISPSASGRIPAGWKGVMAEHNLIYIAANKSGNKVNSTRRMLFALMARMKAGEAFELDPERIYISGFSGGGRMASYVAVLFPQTFTGGLYICGVEYGTLAEPTPAFLARRHVFLTGQRDFNRNETKKRFNAMRADGAGAVHLMDIPNFEHELPRARHLREALTFLDTGAAPE